MRCRARRHRPPIPIDTPRGRRRFCRRLAQIASDTMAGQGAWGLRPAMQATPETPLRKIRWRWLLAGIAVPLFGLLFPGSGHPSPELEWLGIVLFPYRCYSSGVGVWLCAVLFGSRAISHLRTDPRLRCARASFPALGLRTFCATYAGAMQCCTGALEMMAHYRSTMRCSAYEGCQEGR
jgi:hypothetical protein